MQLSEKPGQVEEPEACLEHASRIEEQSKVAGQLPPMHREGAIEG